MRVVDLRIFTVLKSGGEYRPEHVERLRKQCSKWAPDSQFKCLSDLDGTLNHGWPGWWSKIEIMRPDIAVEPFLYMDLDTTIVGSMDDILNRQELTVLSDFYWPDKIQSSFMLVTPDAAATAWSAFNVDSQRHMRECVTRERWGDQGFLEGVWGRKIARWQDVIPHQVVGYKTDVRIPQHRKEHGNGKIPADAKVVISHGLPRPWEVGL